MDGSSSISAAQFKVQKFCMRLFVDRLAPSADDKGVRAGVVQFSNGASILSELNTDKAQLEKIILGFSFALVPFFCFCSSSSFPSPIYVFLFFRTYIP